MPPPAIRSALADAPVSATGSRVSARQAQEAPRLVGDVVEVEKAAAFADDVEQVAVLAGGGVGPFAGRSLRQFLRAGRTSSGPAYCARRRPASSGPRACRWRDSDGTPPRPRARDGAPVRKRRAASRGLPFADALDRIALEHLRQDADAARVGRHEHAQLPGDDLVEEPIGLAADRAWCR